MRRAVAATGTSDVRTLTRHVYGDLPPDTFEMAASGVGGDSGLPFGLRVSFTS